MSGELGDPLVGGGREGPSGQSVVATLLGGQSFRLAVSVASAFIIAAVAGPAAKGRLAAMVAIAPLLCIPLSLGLNSASTYFVAKGTWNGRQAAGLTLAIFLISAPFAYGFATLGRSLPYFGATVILIGRWELVWATSVAVLALMVTGLMIGAGRYRLLSVTTVMHPVLTLLIFCILELAGAGHERAITVSWLAGGALSYVSCTVALVWGLGGLGLPPIRTMPSAFSYGLQSLGSGMLDVLSLRVDVAILAALAPATAVGLYAVAVQVTEVIFIVPTAVGAVVFPRVASAAKGSSDWTRGVLRVTIALCVVAAVIAVGGGSIIFWLVLPAYRGSVAPLLLLIPGALTLAAGRVIVSDMYGRGRPAVAMISGALAVVTMVLLDLLLIPVMGVNGAAVACSVAYGVSAVAAIGWFSRRFRMPLSTLIVPRIDDWRRIWRAAHAGCLWLAQRLSRGGPRYVPR